MFPFILGMSAPQEEPRPLRLFNTKTGTKEVFEPLNSDFVRMYHCGPTVYDYAHIGNLRSYVFADILRRTLSMNGYNVKQVINITDVGHLTGDGDDGEDKMTVALRRENKALSLEAMREVADKYTEAFLENLDQLLIKRPHVLPRASEHIEAQIALIETLIQKEYAYQTSDGIYFDTDRFEGYGKLGNIDTTQLREGARVELNPEKRHATDFALWKFNPEIGWDSPWGRGFPGWHIECSAMSMAHLGKTLDIHTGGIDHIGTHHNNEIAQAEAATGKEFARFWLHNAFITIEGTKVSKSLGNTIHLRHLVGKGYHPLAYRYWLLGGHYRSPMTFTWNALDGAQTALRRLHMTFVDDLLQAANTGNVDATYKKKLVAFLNDDLDTPKCIALLWELVKDAKLSDEDKCATLLYFDKALGLGLHALIDKKSNMVGVDVVSHDELPDEVKMLLTKRSRLRDEKKWSEADAVRDELRAVGYEVDDTSSGPQVTRV